MHIHQQGIRFALKVRHELTQARDEKRRLRNLYTLPALDIRHEKDIKMQMDREVENPTTVFHSHPITAERVQMADALNIPNPPVDSSPSIWELLPAAEIQNEMTAYVQRKFDADKHGDYWEQLYTM
jgi:hypothetical protein